MNTPNVIVTVLILALVVPVFRVLPPLTERVVARAAARVALVLLALLATRGVLSIAHDGLSPEWLW